MIDGERRDLGPVHQLLGELQGYEIDQSSVPAFLVQVLDVGDGLPGGMNSRLGPSFPQFSDKGFPRLGTGAGRSWPFKPVCDPGRRDLELEVFYVRLCTRVSKDPEMSVTMCNPDGRGKLGDTPARDAV